LVWNKDENGDLELVTCLDVGLVLMVGEVVSAFGEVDGVVPTLLGVEIVEVVVVVVGVGLPELRAPDTDDSLPCFWLCDVSPASSWMSNTRSIDRCA